MTKLINKLLTKHDITESDIRCAFQNVAEVTGGDILQCCIDCGEEPVIARDGLFDYLGTYGGDKGKAVMSFCMEVPGSIEDLERVLDSFRVPRTWV